MAQAEKRDFKIEVSFPFAKEVPVYIHNPLVIQAFMSVDRKLFTPHGSRSVYSNNIIPISENSSMSQPLLVAQMMDNLELTGEERVLEVGTASGYGAALLSRCASEVFSVERNELLARTAREKLFIYGFKNVEVHIGDGALGLAQQAPFDAIIVTAGAKEVPQALVSQLREGGRMVLPCGRPEFQELLLVKKKDDGDCKVNNLNCQVNFYPLISDEQGGWKREELERYERMKAAFKERRRRFLEVFAASVGSNITTLRHAWSLFNDIEPDEDWENIDSDLHDRIVALLKAEVKK